MAHEPMKTNYATLEDAVNTLNEKGQPSPEAGCNPDGIAEFLKVEGITGNLGRATSCPVANFVAKATGRGGSASSVLIMTTMFDEGRSSVITPTCLAEFMRKFDSAEYPFLITGNPLNY